jgi:SAM-dependent methyltransferase
MSAPDRAISPTLMAHLDELPLVRRSIFDTVRDFAAHLPHEARVLDAGAGEAPYAELFEHCAYVTVDWPHSVHGAARSADIVASLENLPVANHSFDAVLCTEVLEHVGQPEAVLAELNRVLARQGRLCLTVPFVWPLHEEPFDFYRYTPHALRALLEAAGFADVDVAPRTGYFTTLAQIAEMTGWLQRRPAPLRRALKLRICLHLARACVVPLTWLAKRDPGLDQDLTGVPLPLGYRVLASKV